MSLTAGSVFTEASSVFATATVSERLVPSGV
jgi:hypothetical protein